ncbi:hypothetical protein ONZ51_g8031 [Trametes cubensis]|uniref:26S proteasome complex subunit SEM1 n=1 Tax=Trametes cubensis TaxID=1111947 RepID=A0AAD7TQ88_9APHY|nr:hypothetical protein ONZ51_g8031 [Trametes cubensis]
MSASAASTSQPVQSTSAAVEHTKDDDVPHLGVLEEDDEFEDLALLSCIGLHAVWLVLVAAIERHGLQHICGVSDGILTNGRASSTDWDDSQTDLAHLAGTAPGAAKSGGDKLWEDNWDDDDIEDDFSVQLRNELAKKKGNGGGAEAMQH